MYFLVIQAVSASKYGHEDGDSILGQQGTPKSFLEHKVYHGIYGMHERGRSEDAHHFQESGTRTIVCPDARTAVDPVVAVARSFGSGGIMLAAQAGCFRGDH